MKPHKHAELIKQWADGAQIQVYTNTWNDDLHPLWRPNLDYRIKPEEKKPVVRYLWAIDKGNGFEIHPLFVEDRSIPYPAMRYSSKRLDWSRTEFEE